jgi:hypothetical protein
MLVAKGQKRKGMGWSEAGSINLATVTRARVNGEIGDWTQKRLRIYRPVPALVLAA